MHRRKIIGLSLATILSLTNPVFASDTGNVSEGINPLPIYATLTQDESVVAVPIKVDVEVKTEYKSFTGVVKKISTSESVEGNKIAYVEDKEGTPANIVITKDTYIVNNEKITEGATITGFYDANAPMLMIYPPQYKAEVVSVDKEGQNVKVSVFDKDLVSSDSWLKLNISKDTKIISQDGNTFDGELANRKLVVLYGITTRSIPAQTTPSEIVVLSENTSDTINELTPGEIPPRVVSSMDIVVNDKKIEAPASFTDEHGTVMIPLRAAAEALGFDVKWNGAMKSVTLGNGISLTIGKDNYVYMKTAPIQLGTAPIIVDGRTFVPVSFFKEVVRVKSANIVDSQIVIDNR